LGEFINYSNNPCERELDYGFERTWES
jgi:hypothetical protein